MNKKVLATIAVFTILGCGLFNSESNLEKYNPERFKSVPDDAPFEITLSTQRNEENNFVLQLNISNTTSEKLGLTMNGTGGNLFFTDFFITKQDTGIVWQLYKSNVRILGVGHLIINPNSTVTLEEEWELVDNEGDKIKSGDFFLFGGLSGVYQEQVTEFEDTTMVAGGEIREFGNVGVGRNPITISVD